MDGGQVATRLCARLLKQSTGTMWRRMRRESFYMYSTLRPLEGRARDTEQLTSVRQIAEGKCNRNGITASEELLPVFSMWRCKESSRTAGMQTRNRPKATLRQGPITSIIKNVLF